jgi:hypothetical protein
MDRTVCQSEVCKNGPRFLKAAETLLIYTTSTNEQNMEYDEAVFSGNCGVTICGNCGKTGH